MPMFDLRTSQSMRQRTKLIGVAGLLLGLAAASNVVAQDTKGACGALVIGDDASGHKVVVIRSVESPAPLAVDGMHEVLRYRNGKGGAIRVYSDHAVSQQQAEAMLRRQDKGHEACG